MPISKPHHVTCHKHQQEGLNSSVAASGSSESEGPFPALGHSWPPSLGADGMEISRTELTLGKQEGAHWIEHTL